MAQASISDSLRLSCRWQRLAWPPPLLSWPHPPAWSLHVLASQALPFVGGLMLLSQLLREANHPEWNRKTLPHDPSEFMKGQRFSLPGSDSAKYIPCSQWQVLNLEGSVTPLRVFWRLCICILRGCVWSLCTHKATTTPAQVGTKTKPKLPPTPYLGQIIYMHFHRCSSPSYKMCSIYR